MEVAAQLQAHVEFFFCADVAIVRPGFIPRTLLLVYRGVQGGSLHVRKQTDRRLSDL